jgi:peptidoglycan/xylan/chitin deacetylase (PgdA/CDA1 family)
MLREAGFRTITSRDLRAWLDGGDLPPRAAMVTFDDGPSGLWKYADPVLDDLGMHAVAFVITGSVGKHRPYYLSWNELKRMESSGRWDIESHTRDGHGLVATTATGTRRPFLINRAWLPRVDRLETMDEFRRRVSLDIAASKTDIAKHGLPDPELFAFPFSAEVTPTNDPRAPSLVSDIVTHSFKAAMTNSEPATFASQRDRARRVLPRVEIFARTTPHALFERIAAAAPITPRRLAPLRMPSLWVDSAGRAIDRRAPRGATTDVSPYGSAVRFEKGAARIVPKRGAWLGAFFAPGRLADWSRYRASVTMSELGTGGAGGLLVHVGDADSAVSVNVSTGFISVRRGATGSDVQLVATRIPKADAHTVAVSITGGKLTVRVDGRSILSVPQASPSSGRVGLSANASDSGGNGVVFRNLVIDGMPSA